MKKVLMFQDYFYYGGIEKIILDIKNNIGKDYHIDILSLVNKSNEKVINLLDKDYRRFFKRTFLGLGKYKNYLKNNHYDIIHIHTYNAFGLVYAKIAKKYCKKVILHAHNDNFNSDVLYIRHFINNIIKLLYYRKNYTYLAASENCNKFCFNSKKVIILSNCINYKLYQENKLTRKKYRKLYNISDNEIVIGHIGRFEKQKNHDFLIDIFKEINLLKDNYKLILIGDGLLLSKIKSKVHNLNLDNKVLFLDYRNDIPKLINMFDIYLFPSLYEGFGITVVENEVNGKYVFISDKISKEVIISNRVNRLSLKDSPSNWAKSIINLKRSKYLKLDSRLDISNYIKLIESIYSKKSNNVL